MVEIGASTMSNPKSTTKVFKLSVRESQPSKESSELIELTELLVQERNREYFGEKNISNT